MNRQTINIAIGLFVLLSVSIAPLIGPGKIDLIKAFSGSAALDARILFDIRLPRIVFAFLVGGGLSVVGAVFQALLRNDLATPYTLGVSSGGALGAVIAIKSGLVIQLFGFSTTTLFAIAGSILTILLIFWIAAQSRDITTFRLILAGVTISLLFSAISLFIHYLADFTETYRMVRWLMGSLEVVGWKAPIVIFVILLPILIYYYINATAFNLNLAGEDMALSKGVNLQRLQYISFLLGSILVGSIVSIAGPIGFVGLIIPHILRLLKGPDHRSIIPGSLFLGGAFLICCDTIARMIISPTELPIGIITSMLGGPFFIYLLVRKKDRI